MEKILEKSGKSQGILLEEKSGNPVPGLRHFLWYRESGRSERCYERGDMLILCVCFCVSEVKVWYNMAFYLTLTLTQWPWYSNLTEISRYICILNIKFLGYYQHLVTTGTISHFIYLTLTLTQIGNDLDTQTWPRCQDVFVEVPGLLATRR